MDRERNANWVDLLVVIQTVQRFHESIKLVVHGHKWTAVNAATSDSDSVKKLFATCAVV